MSLTSAGPESGDAAVTGREQSRRLPDQQQSWNGAHTGILHTKRYGTSYSTAVTWAIAGLYLLRASNQPCFVVIDGGVKAASSSVICNCTRFIQPGSFNGGPPQEIFLNASEFSFGTAVDWKAKYRQWGWYHLGKINSGTHDHKGPGFTQIHHL